MKLLMLVVVVSVPLLGQIVNNPLGDLVQNMFRIKQLQIEQQRADTEREAVRTLAPANSALPAPPSRPASTMYTDTVTFGMLNGRAWRNFGAIDGTKLLFLAAYMNGWAIDRLVVSSENAIDTEVHRDELRGPKTYQETLATLDDIYAVPENLGIPIGWAMMAAASVQRGEVDKHGVMMAMRRQIALASDGYSGPDNSPAAVIRSVGKALK
jgi:hypothetical protein